MSYLEARRFMRHLASGKKVTFPEAAEMTTPNMLTFFPVCFSHYVYMILGMCCVAAITECPCCGIQCCHADVTEDILVHDLSGQWEWTKSRWVKGNVLGLPKKKTQKIYFLFVSQFVYLSISYYSFIHWVSQKGNCTIGPRGLKLGIGLNFGMDQVIGGG